MDPMGTTVSVYEKVSEKYGADMTSQHHGSDCNDRY